MRLIHSGRGRLSLALAAMTKGRLEAFSDGVIAILITIMVLELKVPHGADLEAIAHARTQAAA